MLSGKPQTLLACLAILFIEFSQINCANYKQEFPKKSLKLSLLNIKHTSPNDITQVLTPPPNRGDKLMDVQEREYYSDTEGAIFEINLGPHTVPDKSYLMEANQTKDEAFKDFVAQRENEKQLYLKSFNEIAPKHSNSALSKKTNFREITDITSNFNLSPITTQSVESPVPSEFSDRKKNYVWRRKDGKEEEDYNIFGGFPGSEDPFSDDEDYERVSFSSESSTVSNITEEDGYYLSDLDDFEDFDFFENKKFKVGKSVDRDLTMILPSGEECYIPERNQALYRKIVESDFNSSYHSIATKSIIPHSGSSVFSSVSSLDSNNGNSEFKKNRKDMKQAASYEEFDY